MGMSDWVGEPISEIQGAVALILNTDSAVDYINIQMIEKDESGYTRDLRIIVERKSQEGDDEFSHSDHKDRHPSASPR